MDVVAVSTTGGLLHFWFDGSPATAAWMFEAVPGSPELLVGQRPAIVSSREGRVEVYVRGVDNTLWFVALNQQGSSTSWEPWQNLSTGLFSDPAAAAFAPNESIAAVLGGDGNVYARGITIGSAIFPAQSWLRFDGCGGAYGQPGGVVGAPAVVSSAPGRIVVFAQTANGTTCRWDLSGLSSGTDLSHVGWQLTMSSNVSMPAAIVASRTTRGSELAFVDANGALQIEHWNEGSILHPFEVGNDLLCSFSDERQCLWKPTQ